MTKETKKIVSVEVEGPNEDSNEDGYGPEGKHTRRAWRAECLKNLLKGKEQFEAWQRGLLPLVESAPNQKNSINIGLDFSGEIFNCRQFNFTFLIKTYFQGATFTGDTWFNNATFEKDVWFSNATFEGDAVFDHAAFQDFAIFRCATFNGHTDFKNTKFFSKSWFKNAYFKSEAEFENAKFENIGHFEQAKFENKIPDFRCCKIDTTRLEFSDETHFTQGDFTEDAINNISFLKRLSDEHGQKDQALEFNAMELRAKRKLAHQQLFTSTPYEGVLFYIFTLLYEKISDFGRSFTKPLIYLLCLLCLSFIVGIWSAYLHRPVDFNESIFSELNAEYLLTKNDGSQTTPLTAYRAATEYSLYRSGNFLDFTDADKNTASINMRLFGSEIEPWWARMFGFVKGIFTAILLFLIALGLRNKYRVS